ncbi:hypothetical protein, partial [Actinomadura decatromicini]|uniref:hypothetical protein n=1 Tax=Actinomadura decatromicini TaxID=2604572 RepID=UPI001652DFF2
IHLDLPALGLPDDPHHTYTVTDQLDGAIYTWTAANYVHLDPHTKPAHILTIQQMDEGNVRAGESRAARQRVRPGNGNGKKNGKGDGKEKRNRYRTTRGS